MDKIRAAVPDAGLLRVEACGMCGSDVEQFDLRQFGLLDLNSAVVHEPVGYIEEVGAEAKDLVNSGAPAGRSTFCLASTLRSVHKGDLDANKQDTDAGSVAVAGNLTERVCFAACLETLALP